MINFTEHRQFTVTRSYPDIQLEAMTESERKAEMEAFNLHALNLAIKAFEGEFTGKFLSKRDASDPMNPLHIWQFWSK